MKTTFFGSQCWPFSVSFSATFHLLWNFSAEDVQWQIINEYIFHSTLPGEMIVIDDDEVDNDYGKQWKYPLLDEWGANGILPCKKPINLLVI